MPHYKTVTKELQEVSKDNPCPICNGTDWCFVKHNRELAFCDRVDQAPEGWHHFGEDSQGKKGFCLKTGKRKSNGNGYAVSSGKETLTRQTKQKPKKFIDKVEIAKPLTSWKGSTTVGNKTLYPYSQNQWIELTRFDNGKKSGGFHHIDSDGKNQKGKGSNHWFPYGYEALDKENSKDKFIFAAEGQKDVETLIDLGFGAIDSKFLSNENLLRIGHFTKGFILIPDHDKAGYDLARKIAEKAQQYDLEILMIDPLGIYPKLDDKGDITDIFETMQDKEKLIEQLYKAIEQSRNAHNERAIKEEKDQLKGWTIQAPNEKEEPKPDSLSKPNLIQFVRERFGDRLALNKLGDQVELDGEQYLVEEAHLLLAEKYWINNGKDICGDIFAYIAEENAYDPVRNYLDAVYDNEKQIDISNLATRYLGTNNPLYDIFVKKMLISAVARIYENGCKVDTALILKGDQGIGKSSFFNTLAGEWFDDSMGDGKSKDDWLRLYRCWFQEWGEIDRIFLKRVASEVKAFLSKSNDSFRVPYGRSTKRYERRAIIVGSTNNDEFLNDPTGSRRFWVIPCEGKINLSLLEKERSQIWASAVQAYKDGEQWWLTEEEEKLSRQNNEVYQELDIWTGIVENWLEKNYTDLGFTTLEVLENAIDLEPEKMDKRSQMRVANLLKNLGYEQNKPQNLGGKKVRLWKKKGNEIPGKSGSTSAPDQPQGKRLIHPESIAVKEIQKPDQPDQPFSKKMNTPTSSSTANTALEKVLKNEGEVDPVAENASESSG